VSGSEGRESDAVELSTRALSQAVYFHVIRLLDEVYSGFGDRDLESAGTKGSATGAK
jgi:hypothetical protein